MATRVMIVGTDTGPAGTVRIGGTYDVGGELIDETGTVRTVNYAFINANTLGSMQLVAAQGGAVRVRVLSAVVVTTLAVSVKFQSAATDISATFPFGANGGLVINYSPQGWFQTVANEALNVNLGLATATGVQVAWVQAT